MFKLEICFGVIIVDSLETWIVFMDFSGQYKNYEDTVIYLFILVPLFRYLGLRFSSLSLSHTHTCVCACLFFFLEWACACVHARMICGRLDMVGFSF